MKFGTHGEARVSLLELHNLDDAAYRGGRAG